VPEGMHNLPVAISPAHNFTSHGQAARRRGGQRTGRRFSGVANGSMASLPLLAALARRQKASEVGHQPLDRHAAGRRVIICVFVLLADSAR
jgi:hypothetical protein